MKPDRSPCVCIVGRPNVGKSTLFNRMLGRRKAVVHDVAGTTRDRIEATVEMGGKTFRLIDTGGLVRATDDKIISLVKRQVEEAIAEADLILFVCDVTSGVTQQDEEVVSILRKTNKKVFVVVNKVDNRKLEGEMYDFSGFGLGEPYPVSAVHNIGINDLLDEIARSITDSAEGGAGAIEVFCKIAIVGRPNVGKSLFLNTLLQKERVIVDNVPGTTRDSIDTYFEKDGNVYMLIDTAGIRHKRKVKEAVDFYSMLRSHETIEKSDVVLLLIDGYDGLRVDDIRVFDYIISSGKCCVLVVNKWDLVKGIPMAEYKETIIARYHVAADYPIVFASAKTARNVLSCVEMARSLVANASQKMSMKDLSEFLSNLRRSSVKVTMKGFVKLNFLIQTGSRPPTFLFLVSDTKLVTREYERFVENELRRAFNFYGTPVKTQFRRKS